MAFTGLDDIARVVAIAAVVKGNATSIRLENKYSGNEVITVTPRSDGYFDVKCGNGYSGNIGAIVIAGNNWSEEWVVPPFYVSCDKGDVVTIGAKVEYQPVTDDWGISTPKDITSNNTQITWPSNIIEALVATIAKRVSTKNIGLVYSYHGSDALVALVELDVSITAKENQDGTVSLESTWPTICLDSNCEYKIVAGGQTPQLNIPPGKTVTAKHYVLLKYQNAQG